LDQAHARFDSGMAVGVFRDVAFHPVATTEPTVPSVIVLSDDSSAVLPERLVSGYQRAGWQIRRLPGVHHDMQLEAPDRTFALLAELL
jgi:pimeloyl-ACP methyl ester carboxylesterase